MDWTLLKTLCAFLLFTNTVFAELRDAGVVGPKGEVVLFYKEGSVIVVKECLNYTVLNTRNDCVQKPGTEVARVPSQDFKKKLKDVLKLPIGNFSPEMTAKIDLFNKLADEVELVRQRNEVKFALDRIQEFIDTYGEANADLAEKARLEERLNKLNRDLELSREINGLIDNLVDRVIASNSLSEFVYSHHQTGFEFNILRSYLRQSSRVEVTFVDIPAGTFFMGSDPLEEGHQPDEVRRQVTLTKSFQFQVAPVTQLQYFSVMGVNPSSFKEAKHMRFVARPRKQKHSTAKSFVMCMEMCGSGSKIYMAGIPQPA